jgi:acetyltransferase-like isoleucine patch superfamily enzyme
MYFGNGVWFNYKNVNFYYSWVVNAKSVIKGALYVVFKGNKKYQVVKVMLKTLVSQAIKRIKGHNITLDRDLKFGDLLRIIYQRSIMLIAASLRGWNTLVGVRCIVFFGNNVVIRHRKYVTIGSGSTLGRGVKIDGLSKNGVKLGLNVNLGDYTIIKCTGSLSNLGEGVDIGKNVGIGPFAYIGAAGGITIGENCIMGSNVGFYAENHNFDGLDVLIKDQGVSRKGIKVGANCWVGSNTVFLDGCNVGEGCVIAAGSVVRGSVPNNSVIAGVPAKIISHRGSL